MRLGYLVILAIGTVAAIASNAIGARSRPACAVRSVTVSTAGRVAAFGGCTAGGRAIPSRWSYRYAVLDDERHACTAGGFVTGKGRWFVTKPEGGYRVTGAVTLTARGGGAASTRSFARTLGGGDLDCGIVAGAPLPAPATLCPWDDPNAPLGVTATPPARFENCGVSNDYASFSSPPIVEGTTISAGHIVSRGGWCAATASAITTNAGSFKAVRAFDWLGARQQGKQYACADGSVIWISALIVLVPVSGGGACASILNPMPSFQIPAAWGGTLYVQFHLGAIVGKVTSSGHLPSKVESETAIVPLRGTEGGCPIERPVPLS